MIIAQKKREIDVFLTAKSAWKTNAYRVYCKQKKNTLCSYNVICAHVITNRICDYNILFENKRSSSMETVVKKRQRGGISCETLDDVSKSARFLFR